MINSDKQIKGLFNLYDELFHKYRISGTLVEVGILNGGSLEWFRDTGRFEKIIGCDINIPDIDLGPKVILRHVDQGSDYDLDNLTKEFPPFDVVIDDGSHMLPHVIKTFDHLWPYTKKMYIIEDWDVAYQRTDWFHDWTMWIVELIRQKDKLGAEEIRICFNSNPNSYHGYIMLRR